MRNEAKFRTRFWAGRGMGGIASSASCLCRSLYLSVPSTSRVVHRTLRGTPLYASVLPSSHLSFPCAFHFTSHSSPPFSCSAHKHVAPSTLHSPLRSRYFVTLLIPWSLSLSISWLVKKRNAEGESHGAAVATSSDQKEVLSALLMGGQHRFSHVLSYSGRLSFVHFSHSFKDGSLGSLHNRNASPVHHPAGRNWYIQAIIDQRQEKDEILAPHT